MSETNENGKTRILLWGLAFMTLFIYVNAFLLVSVQVLVPGEGYVFRYMPESLKVAGRTMHLVLLCLSLPAWRLALRVTFDGSIYRELIYYPLLAGIIWFAYGCIIGWARKTRRVMITLIVLIGFWAVLLWVGWMRGMMYPIPGN